MKTTKLPSGRRLPTASRSVRSKVSPKHVRIGRILVPIDFSEGSGQAIDQAHALSQQFNSEVDLVHVYEPVYPITGLAGIPLFVPDAEVERRVRRHLHSVARRHHLQLSKDNIHSVKGRPFEEICRLGVNRCSDLIVIPTRGNTGLKHLVLGSTAERVVRHACCPVLVTRPKKQKRSRNVVPDLQGVTFRRILVPVDFSDCSLKGLAYAKRLAAQFGSTLVVLHCLPPRAYVANEEYARYDLPLLMQRVEQAATEQLSELVDSINREGIETEAALETGHPGQQICSESLDCGADLIVTATHGNTGLKHVFLGSTAEYVVRHAACSVLVVPTRERPILM